MKTFISYLRRAIAFNEAEGERFWIKAANFGIHPNKAGRQKLNTEIAERLVATFTEEQGVAANEKAEGLPIYIGHPDVNPDKYPEHRRHGGIYGAKVENRALWLEIAWNDLGVANAQAKKNRFPSIVWEYEDGDDGSIIPTRIVSLGLTDFPNMRDVPAAINERDVIDEDADEASTPETKTMTLQAQLRAFLALNDDADETAILTAFNDYLGYGDVPVPRTLRQILYLDADATIEQVKAAIGMREAEMKLLKAGVESLKQKLADEEARATAANERATALEADLVSAQAARKAANDHAAEVLIQVAMNDGRLTAAEVEATRVAFNDDFAAAAQTLAEKKTAYNTKEGVKLDGKGLRQAALADNEKSEARLKAANDELSAAGGDFTRAWLAAKAKNPALFE